MTYEERLKYFCEQSCHDRLQCGYVNRGMISDCTYLQDIMEGWEAGYQDAVDEAACQNDHCPKKLSCLRWQSEDERIRKKLISAIKEDWPGHTDWIAWIEKQGKNNMGTLPNEPVSEDLKEAAKADAMVERSDDTEVGYDLNRYGGFIAGAKWQKGHLWKPADGDNLPDIDKEVIALTQPYPDDEHLRVVFAHRPSKYTKVWNYDLGEEQVVEVERYGKGGWNIPNVKYWLDCSMPKEIEL